jgi:hypothetical protein
LQPKKVAQRVALWEKRVMEERTSEIFKRLQRKQMEVVREAEEAEYKQEQLWREQGSAPQLFRIYTKCLQSSNRRLVSLHHPALHYDFVSTAELHSMK